MKEKRIIDSQTAKKLGLDGNDQLCVNSLDCLVHLKPESVRGTLRGNTPDDLRSCVRGLKALVDSGVNLDTVNFTTVLEGPLSKAQGDVPPRKTTLSQIFGILKEVALEAFTQEGR